MKTASQKSPTPARNASRGGFSLVEMLLVVVIVGVLVQITLPNYRAMIVRARAADIMGDIDVVNTAVLNYYGQSDNFTYPPDAATGTPPPELAGFLPEGFSFDGDGYQLDWENFTAGSNTIRGVGVVTANTQLANALMELVGTGPWYASGSKLVFILEN